jgi:hypothetical protein
MVAIDTAKSKSARGNDRRAVQIMIIEGVLTPNLVVDTTPAPLNFSEGDATSLNRQFIKVLEDLRKDVQRRGVDLRDYEHNYLERLRDIGKQAYNKVLPCKPEPPTARLRITEIENYVGQRGLSLTFITPPTYLFFWEMLYAGTLLDIETNQFWGFRYPIGRAFWQIPITERIQLQSGVFAAVHEGLTSSRQEVSQIENQLEAANKLLGLHLNVRLLEHLLPPENLSVEHLLALFHSEEFDFGIIHLACHAESDEEALEAFLSFTAHKDRLKMCLGKLLTWQEYGFLRRPFVFINACSSATPGHLLRTFSFPTEMLNFGAGGVIATACTIPDNFASAFASELYKRILGNADSSSQNPPQPPTSNIGEALLATRRYFLEKFNNPLGLAYGLYAVSNQELRFLD